MDKKTEVVSLLELNRFIRQIMSLNFPESIWVQAEIAQVNVSKGHYYISLWQKDAESDAAVAQSNALLWARDFTALKKVHGKALNEVLAEGVEVKIAVEVQFHERFGHSLHIRDIDPMWTFGQLAVKRRLTIEALSKKGLLDKNKAQCLPPVLQRIAVISSERAAGLHDFMEHLQENPFGYAYDLTLFHTAVQGQNVLADVEKALKNIKNLRSAFDCLVIIRGGGARTDLSAFDHIDLCTRVAKFPLPVIVGIGHEVDETVLDLVAFRSLKTPTAVADYLLTHNQFFEGNLIESWRNIQQAAQFNLHNEVEENLHKAHSLGTFVQKKLQNEQFRLLNAKHTLNQSAAASLKSAALQVDKNAAILHALDPTTILKRGYTLTTSAEKTVTSPADVSKGDTIKTHTKAGTFESTVH